MNGKLSRIRWRELALLITLVCVLAILTACGDQGAGLDGEQVGARTEQSQSRLDQSQPTLEQEQSAEPLSLTLTGPSRCTTKRGQSYGIDEAIYDDDGNYLRSERRFASHLGVKEFQVSWTVSGGTGPYALTIDGASEDRSGPFTGASGQGKVFCANTTVPSFVDDAGNRGFRANPMIDSGTKTVRAVVTDANGQTAETSIKVYVILSISETGAPLSAGETYRVEGHLYTIPLGVQATVGGYEEVVCEGANCEDSFNINLNGDDFVASMHFGVRWGHELPDSRYIRLKDGARGASEAESRRQEVDRLLDELSDSAGVEPTPEGAP